jgi:hypothetical protein
VWTLALNNNVPRYLAVQRTRSSLSARNLRVLVAHQQWFALGELKAFG